MISEKQLGGLWCHEVAAHLEAHVAGTLEPEVRVAVESHVSGCSQCASFGARYAALVARVRAGVADQSEAVDDVDAAARIRKRLGEVM